MSNRITSALGGLLLLSSVFAGAAHAEPVNRGSILEFKGIETANNNDGTCSRVARFRHVRSGAINDHNDASFPRAIPDINRASHLSSTAKAATVRELVYGWQRLQEWQERNGTPTCYWG